MRIIFDRRKYPSRRKVTDAQMKLTVAAAQVANGDMAGARATAQRIAAWAMRDRTPALLAVARAQAEGGDAAGAWATATAIPDKGLRGEAEKKVALALARAGAPARLIEIARRESGPYRRVIVLAQGAEDIMKHTSELR